MDLQNYCSGMFNSNHCDSSNDDVCSRKLVKHNKSSVTVVLDTGDDVFSYNLALDSIDKPFIDCLLRRLGFNATSHGST